MTLSLRSGLAVAVLNIIFTSCSPAADAPKDQPAAAGETVPLAIKSPGSRLQPLLE